MDRERPSASEGRIPDAWIGQEVMLETTETLSSDLRAAAPVYLEDVNDRGVVMLVTRHHDQRSEEHTSELQSRQYLVCRLLLEKKKHPYPNHSRVYRKSI